MRITPTEIEHLIAAISPFIHGRLAELRLYGSRLDDNLKGGDIDLLLLLKDELTANEIKMKKHYVLSAIKKNLGDQKIDLTIASQESLSSTLFLSMISENSKILHIWAENS